MKNNRRIRVLIIPLFFLLTLFVANSYQLLLSPVGAADITTCLKTGGFSFNDYQEWGVYACTKNGWTEAQVTDCGHSSGETCEMETACKTPGQTAGVCNGKEFPLPE